MHPALSVIFFTVISGAGYGLFMLLALAGMFTGVVSPQLGLAACVLALVLVTAGLISSTFHLANPKNAWRSFSRFKTSWLSREGVLAVLFYLPALLYTAGWWFDWPAGGGWNLLSLLVLVLALVIVFCTGMIYACLKPIRQWHTALTPANYILLGLMLGALLLLFLQTKMEGRMLIPYILVALATVLIALIMKLIYYGWIRRVRTGTTINTATGFTRARVRLLDVGHTAGTFLTSEFSYTVSRNWLSFLRTLSVILGFIVPMVLLILMLRGMSSSVVAGAALLVALVGIFIERWLFFADARHVVNLYHGAQRT